MLMGTNDGGIDDQVFEVRIVGHRFENPPPDALMAPAAEPAKTLFQSPKTSGKSRHGEPVRTIQSAFNEHPIVAAGRALLIRTPNNQRRHPIPSRIV
jgi:hypothetical protein